MSKKKNTLKDLDEFLKQQAATLVPPTPLSEKADTPPQPSLPEVKKPIVEDKTIEKIAAPAASKKIEAELSLERILEDIETLAQREGTSFRKKVYDLVLQAADTEQNSSPEDKMLINTVLYLANGTEWKNAIRNYWREKG
jgi:hypothetical protein